MSIKLLEMKRLLNSSKFWLAVIGSVFSMISYYLTENYTYAMYIGGFFGAGILGNAAEDYIKTKRDSLLPTVDPDKDKKPDGKG